MISLFLLDMEARRNLDGLSITTIASIDVGESEFESNKRSSGNQCMAYCGGSRNQRKDCIMSDSSSMTEIVYCVVDTYLGTALIASSKRGVKAVLLGAKEALLVDDLRRRFPEAHLVAKSDDAVPWAKQTIHAIEHSTDNWDIPVDQHGTPLQQKVWRALCMIPFGTTASYKKIAANVGDGINAKEVGEACAANAVAVLIPCHRVVRSDGTLAGYRWGANRKLALLQREGAIPDGETAVVEHMERLNWLFKQDFSAGLNSAMKATTHS
jgi:O-6-methylguanine DNA methyltransferase